MEVDKKEKLIKQIHTDIPMHKYKEFIRVLPEARMVSLAVRCFILSYIEEVKAGENPWIFLHRLKNKVKPEDIDNGT